MMQRIVDFFAPVGLSDAIVKFVIFQAMIAPFNLVIYHAVLGASWGTFAKTLLSGFLVSAPFIVLALAMLAHLQKLRCQLAELASTDMLTGLLNRRAFLGLIGSGPEDVLATDGTMLMIDIDHFKRINDTYGHEVGDLCLRAVANFLQNLVHEKDYIARIGGEEFGCFTTRDAHFALEVAQKLASGLRIDAGPHGFLELTMSVGSARSAAGSAIKQALSRADKALYAAKGAGRARCISWSDNMEMNAGVAFAIA